MTNLRLKKWVKVSIGIIFIAIMVTLYVASRNQFKVSAIECDKIKGYTCSYYEVEQFMKR